MKEHFNFNCNLWFCLALLVLILTIPCVMFLPERYGYENGIIENLQMVCLFLSCFYAIRAKKRKSFFNFILMLLILFILREINYGRTLFFPVPGVENEFLSWRDIKYGWIVNPLVGLYVAAIVGYGLFNKVLIDLKDLLTYMRKKLHKVLYSKKCQSLLCTFQCWVLYNITQNPKIFNFLIQTRLRRYPFCLLFLGFQRQQFYLRI